MEQPQPQKPRTDEPDPELLALAGASTRPSILRPFLMIAVIVLGLWIISDWRQELSYFMLDATPVDLGDAIEFADDERVELGHNVYVSVRGIPTQRSQSTRYRFFRLVGSPIFVEEKRDDVIEDPLQRELEGDAKGDVDRTIFQGAGRLMKFSEMPQRYQGLRHYYRSRYNLTFCEELTPAKYKEVEHRKRDAIIAQLRAEYSEADPEERARRKLTPEPPAELVEELLADDPVCVEAWLLQDDVPPRGHLWYLIATLMFLGFVLLNCVLLVRWVIAFVRS